MPDVALAVDLPPNDWPASQEADMNDESQPRVLVEKPEFPDGHEFPVDLLQQWVAIPDDEQLFIGPLARKDLDQFLFSISDLANAIAHLRGAVLYGFVGDREAADASLQNVATLVQDGVARNRTLFQAIMQSAVKARNAGK
jgi:hypothetical protein